jgi:hypothetical protein
MDDKTKKLKALVKNAIPKETYGTDPNDPWSAKAGITEGNSLEDYLRSRGINPNFISKETKISHAKSSAFLKWQQDHQVESVEVSESSLNSNNPEEDYKEKNKVLHQLSMNKQVDQKVVQQRKLDLDKEYSSLKKEEKLDELKKSTLASYVKNAHKDATYHSNAAGFVAGVKQPKYNTSDDTPQEKKREKGIERALGKLTKEDTYQDSYAATQTVFDGGNNPDDTMIKKRELSKSARIIKSIYKRKGVVKEDLYDTEKEDKSVESYGKKPKVTKTDEKDSLGDNKPEAAMVMKGGKTLTGVERDMIEIDPLLKTRPNQVMNQVVNTSKK